MTFVCFMIRNNQRIFNDIWLFHDTQQPTQTKPQEEDRALVGERRLAWPQAWEEWFNSNNIVMVVGLDEEG